MTDFEKQLVKVIEHQCPICGCIDDFLDISKDHRGLLKIICPRCASILWAAETGWIPELQEIVKGE